MTRESYSLACTAPGCRWAHLLVPTLEGAVAMARQHASPGHVGELERLARAGEEYTAGEIRVAALRYDDDTYTSVERVGSTRTPAHTHTPAPVSHRADSAERVCGSDPHTEGVVMSGCVPDPHTGSGLYAVRVLARYGGRLQRYPLTTAIRRECSTTELDAGLLLDVAVETGAIQLRDGWYSIAGDGRLPL